MSGLFKEAFRDEAEKIFTAFTTWGLGMLVMVGYGYFVLWLKNNFNVYVMIAGALLFLTVAFFFIDLWWSYNRLKQLNRIKGL
ncbi:MAG: hypothetical protein ACOY4Q_11335 [Bacillota bacterium]